MNPPQTLKMTKRPLDLEPVDSATIATLAGKVSTLACWVFIASIFSAIISLRCLYGDGSFQLTETLKAGNFVAVAMNRDCASYIFQLPVVTALKLGCNNLYLLQLAFGVGCFVPWLIALMFCYQMAPRNFWLAMIGCGFGYLNASFMPVGEYIIAHAFFWPILFAVLFVRPLKPLAAGMMLISALILVYSYESLLFLGPALALVAAERLLGKGEKGWARIVFAVTTGLLLCAAWIALGGVLHPDCPGNFGGFKRGHLHLEGLDFFAEIFRCAPDHESSDEHGQHDEHEHSVESRADPTNDDFAELNVEQRHKSAERREGIVH